MRSESKKPNFLSVLLSQPTSSFLSKNSISQNSAANIYQNRPWDNFTVGAITMLYIGS